MVSKDQIFKKWRYFIWVSMLWSSPQEGALTQCYLTPKDQVCSLLYSLHIPLHSNIPSLSPLCACLLDPSLYSNAQKSLHVLPIQFLYTWSLISLVDYSSSLFIKDLCLVKNRILLQNLPCSRIRACWRTFLAQKQELVEEFCLHKNKSLLKPLPTEKTLPIQEKECPQRIFIKKPWIFYYSL